MNKDDIINEIREMVQPIWLDPKSLEKEYGFSVNRQARLRVDKVIPYHKIGSYIRYLRSEIDQWIIDHKVV